MKEEIWEQRFDKCRNPGRRISWGTGHL